ncbi:alpha-keto-acid decarboxylase [Clostridium pasteurianum DSM 525 = ATCC 6013]|uniref:Alpha-keto-acid decarboxylase n=1 Tax=Clostridium pasteurianum DSM 525 = ATCC 6013 TaxID=1262449 RepID=A0A0H3J6G1_CLOPA|nr:thiamine pyrophosphate-binding protein [Clostridium pasteurianum]AJA46540.1 alpha-keto-acid decarboxylase [Clostridium pasteurianum DSM 525 = ATCC 6013]AJA50528.1 alpha-keto-acid decarboxylase [Clostridium pasteurianum DSM 525 = ATCC 6013]AOZ73964.1 thiamine pyrophosphate-binding protein [Clostridium pasteurianum DSM 525 = ATCC 6013]AOZ77761.1 thiamine pyrophosphate-binding protein [Clostridium pasteurianum]ELP61112.1 thiamine pyrophosphate binding domain-containing protein [Clostridium pas
MFEKNQLTVGRYLFNCLNSEGISEIFGVPGDYNFTLLDNLEKDERINFVGCRNELNAGYAADAYARIKGLSVMITTFGVGELNACNAIAGAYSEYVPIVHIVGAPKTMVQMEHRKMHHTLMNGDYSVYENIYKNITAYTAVITKDNAQIEIPTAIKIAKEMKRPVYLVIAIDVVDQPVTKREINLLKPQTNQNSLQLALDNIKQVINRAQKPVLLPDIMVSRYNLQSVVESLADKMDIPVATMMAGKGSFNESHKNYIGLYAGRWGSLEVKDFVEGCDCILAVGPIWSDYNTGSFSAQLNPVNIIEIQPNYVKVGMSLYENVLMEDLLNELVKIVEKKSVPIPNIKRIYNENNNINGNDQITSVYYYPKLQNFIKENDIVIVESGSLPLGMAEVRLPKSVTYICQYNWGSIGYATPAAFGACVADRNRRIVLFTGDGSIHLTAQELSSIIYNGCKPVIFLINNKYYTIEAYLNAPKTTEYNNIPVWDFQKLIEAFGGNAYTARVNTNEELDKAIEEIEIQGKDKMCFIEINADKMDVPEIVHNVHTMIEEMEKQKMN